MLQLMNLDRWYPESFTSFIEEDHYMREIAKELYADEFNEYCEEFKEEIAKANGTLDQTFIHFVSECLDDNDVDRFYEVLEVFARKRKYKAFVIDCYMDDHADYWTLLIHQIVPLDKRDLLDLVEVYMQEIGSDNTLAEVVLEKMLPEEGDI